MRARQLLDTEARGGAVMRRGAPLGKGLRWPMPCRCGSQAGFTRCILTGEEPALEDVYEGRPSDGAELIAGAIERHEPYLMPWLDGPPQTNEAGRSANLAGLSCG